MKQYVDQMGRIVNLPLMPQRIISLVPSQTEWLLDLGLSSQVIGITRYCLYPENLVRNKTIVGGTKHLNFEVIRQLQPDLIIGNKEENDKIQINELEQQFPVWMSDITRIEDAYQMMEAIAEITGKKAHAAVLMQEVTEALKKVKNCLKGKRVAYIIWRKPYMAVGKQTYINSLLEWMGAENVFLHQPRYPTFNLLDLKALQPDYIMLSSEPYAFSEKHFDEFREAAGAYSEVCLVDGERMSWYGSRMRYLINPLPL
ncbi:MAG: helical backbone metal receptor [Chitinophagales bacterium]